MPGLSGYDICRMIRENQANKHVPVMILSALNNSESRTLALKLGADSYLGKFFETDEFLACVNSMLRIKRLFRELDHKALEYEKLNRLKSELLSMVSHDLKSPLSAIIGYTMLLQEGTIGALSAEQEEVVHTILESSRHMFNLVNDLLDISRLEEGKLELRISDVEIPMLLEMATDELGILCDIKKQKLLLEITSNMPVMKGDFTRLKQVINNLISNANKFTPENGVIIVRAYPKDKTSFMIEVEDNGVGIPPKNLAVLFNRYQKSSKKGTLGEKGTGLGLAISKEIIEAHRGEIRVESAVGKGSHFFIRLPYDRRVAMSQDYVKIEAKPRLLIVDGQVKTLQVIEKALGQEFDLTCADNPDDAFKLLKKKNPALIIIDLLTSKTNGNNLLARIKNGERLSRVPVIALAPRNSFLLKRDIYGSGFDAYLLKPFKARELNIKVKYFLRIERRSEQG